MGQCNTSKTRSLKRTLNREGCCVDRECRPLAVRAAYELFEIKLQKSGLKTSEHLMVMSRRAGAEPMGRKVVSTILPTTMVGSYPRPGWYQYQLLGRDI